MSLFHPCSLVMRIVYSILYLNYKAVCDGIHCRTTYLVSMEIMRGEEGGGKRTGMEERKGERDGIAQLKGRKHSFIHSSTNQIILRM